ncbi:splicing factor u2af-associated protein 2 [Coprinopsis cinerea okayama7|uniref:Splicing factor u2af-associated protein 2 n=1 Tax=Coprinopsis cinerea (strain Okayama-7 / 130 / ATCC MYA-4618 / FGSC 9003) TaxID=240176 RepID=A8N5M2_COPC7|nr:splicing factor u2af-associated protein 2 [Coprinopsis cinerea okayama7\|eukprot:XP_001830167.1 splicing factor u2af-associated protein 2 [Coprinopsis cinerea okayama7\
MSAPPPSAAAGSSAEAQAAAFADDPRVYFNKESNTWRLEQEDGPELEYDSTRGTWEPVLDDLIKRQQAAYSVAGVDEETPAAPVLKRENKKRKVQDYTYAPTEGEPSSKRGKNNQERKSKNTAVYVTGLPLDAEADEIVARFSKCGVIEEDDNGEPKVKMYAKEDGTFSGEALVVYFKEDSVLLAENLLDEAELRLGDASTVMRVRQADFTHKNENKDGVSQPRRVVDKKAATRRIGKMQKKLNEWGFDDGFGPQPDPEDKPVPRTSRVVVLKHMFTIEELEKDATLLLDLKEDVREECSTLGEVTNVTLYDKEPEGIMTVKFKDPLSAQACVIKMNGRFFDGRKIVAELFVGRQRFKRSDAKDDYGEGEEAEKKRLDDFAQWLMQEGE